MIENNKFSGLRRRFCAYLVDFFFICLFFSLLMLFFCSKFLMAVLVAFGFISNVLGWLYFAFFESSPLQGTLGKWLLGIKVVDKQGNRLTFKRATLRFFGKWLSAMILWTGFLMIAFSRKKQGLHDKLARTYVIRRS